MTVRRINLILRASSMIMIAGAAGAIVSSVVLPLEIDNPAADAANGSSADADLARSVSSAGAGSSLARSPLNDLPPLDQFASVFSAQLRGQSIAHSSTVTSAAGLTLVGTIGDHLAIVRTGDDTQVRSVGEQFEGGQIIAVRDGQADLRTPAGVLTLRKQADAAAPEYIHGDLHR